jgi:tol-pal system protein YbgF
MSMKRIAALPIAVLVAALGLPSDVSAANREHQQMMADIRMLQEQAQQIQVLLTALNEALKGVYTRIDDQTAQNRKAFADSRMLIEGLGRDVGILREKVDDTNIRISTMSQEVEALRLAIPQSAPAPVTPGDATAPPGTAPAVDAPPVIIGQSPTRLMDTAKADYAGGQFSTAIMGFESFLKSFPRSELAHEAQFFIGESQFQDGKYKEAIAAYDQLIAAFPKSTYVATAYYKRGLAYESLLQRDRARESFETAIKNYPTSDAAGLAKQALDRLNRPARE